MTTRESGESGIRIRVYKDVDLTGATVVEAVPSHGLAAAIVGSYLVRELDLDHVAGFDSDDFPPVSMVWKGKPRSPLRLYAREAADGKPPFAVLISEFTPVPALYRPLARCVRGWAERAGVARIISPDGAPTGRADYAPATPHLGGVGSTERAREALVKAGIDLMPRGMVSGVSAMLLTETLDALDVLHLMVELNPDPEGRVHDARAAAVLLEAVKRLMPDLGVPVKPLLEEAQRAEAAIRELRSSAVKQAGDDVQAAYR